LGLGAEEGLAFGRYQPIPIVARKDPGVQRRLSGGRLLPVGPGVLEVSLAAPGLTDLTAERNPIGPEQLLNRSVRGVLRGLERLGLSVVYPGRDLITLSRRAVGHAGFDIDGEGRPLVQIHLAYETSLAEAASHLEEAGLEAEGRGDLLEREGCVTLREVLGGEVEIERVEEALIEGFGQHAGAPLAVEPLPGELMERSEALFAETFSRGEWLAERSPPPEMDHFFGVQSQLGTFQVALSREEEEEDRLGAVKLMGEFFADWPAVAALEEALKGCPAGWLDIARIVDLILDTPPHIVLGIGPRRTIPDTIVKALSYPARPTG
jgi:lipoate-protein ligase A